MGDDNARCEEGGGLRNGFTSGKDQRQMRWGRGRKKKKKRGQRGQRGTPGIPTTLERNHMVLPKMEYSWWSRAGRDGHDHDDTTKTYLITGIRGEAASC